MPLPAALLAKLAKRGIVNDGVKGPKEQEEIIAEDYDDLNANPENYNHPSAKRNENFWVERLKRRLTTQKITGVKGCPNKYNVHHSCSLFCVEKYGEGNPTPSKAYKKRFKRLLDRYPLPAEKSGVHEWVTIYDPGCSSYYFWNKADDLVCWLPPKHPKAGITKSAATLRREINEKPDLEDNETEQHSQEEEPQNEEAPEKYKMPNPPPKKPKSRDLEKILKSKHRRNNPETGKLDPMDPAAYSDCPRGKWSSGLNVEDKSAVDQTASGTLFQMRPYPSPGDILRANKRKNDSDEERDRSDDERYPTGKSRERDRRRSPSDDSD